MHCFNFQAKNHPGMVVVVVVVVVVALEPATLLMVAVVGRGMSTDLFPDDPALKVILLGLVQ